MFGIKKLLTRIEVLEQRMAVIDREKRCAVGLHEWELNPRERKPDVRCKHCFIKPKEAGQ